MANLDNDSVQRLSTSMASREAGNEIASAINLAERLAAQYPYVIAAMIVATDTSTTVDFGALAVGDQVIQVPVTQADGADFLTVVTAGTLPEAAVVGDLYIVIRALDLAAAKALARTTLGL